MSSTLVRYLIVAVLAYVIDMGGYYVLLKMGVDPIWANVAVKILAAICGFFMHRRFTYQIKEADGQMAHATKYFGLALLYTPISSVVLYLLMLVIPHPVYAKAIADVLLFIVTFWVTSSFTFTRKKSGAAAAVGGVDANEKN
ncbi:MULTISPECIES: GtrA family protein [Herbaspirillum]|uniref:GtrA family protein n=1 Tax=Herbaspirillum TaxID=963 RepID=UPI00034A5725|nr:MULTISPECIES: GtrA family protein [Herbaspirillum]MAF02841.1 GtrA family protein [Herbaspirillum sp.]MBN9355067.1 GtrA family protein [Herbaspirillum huttiense]MBO15391.1 GtrA family protein [Herbaspirillum sp.]MEE1637576.1 GtrA family protein [Herbaspirillum huttiense NC40101]|tara:strand:+ start:700 stop:1125 length:426 start_codon:yes stop_codon:yes gene_type:complete